MPRNEAAVSAQHSLFDFAWAGCGTEAQVRVEISRLENPEADIEARIVHGDPNVLERIRHEQHSAVRRRQNSRT
jgi:hypothetical protein